MAQRSLLAWVKKADGSTPTMPSVPVDQKAFAKKKLEESVRRKAPKNKDAAVAPYVRFKGDQKFIMSQEEIRNHPYKDYRLFEENYRPDPDNEDLEFCPLQYDYRVIPNQTPEIYFYGPGADGTRISAITTGFEPYFYASLSHIWFSEYARYDRAVMETLGLQLYQYLREWTRQRIMEDENLYRKHKQHLRDGYAMLELTQEQIEKGIVQYNVKDMKGCTIDFTKDPKGVQETAPCIKICVGAPALVPFLRQFFWYPRGINAASCGLCGLSGPEGHLPSPFTDGRMRSKEEVDEALGASFLERERDTKWPPILKHDSRCPAVFHASCVKVWRRAQRLRGDIPDESKSKKYKDRSMLFRCPCCQSRAHSVHHASFEMPPRPVPPTRGAGKFKGRDWKPNGAGSRFFGGAANGRRPRNQSNNGSDNYNYAEEFDQLAEDDYLGSEETYTDNPDTDAHSVYQSNRPNKYRRYADQYTNAPAGMQGAVGSHRGAQELAMQDRGPRDNSTQTRIHQTEKTNIDKPDDGDWRAKTAQQPIRGWFDEFAERVNEIAIGGEFRRLPLPRPNELYERCRWLQSVHTNTLLPPASMSVDEANVNFDMRARIDKNLPPSRPVRIPKGKYMIVPDALRRTTVTLEVRASIHDLELLEAAFPKIGDEVTSKTIDTDDPRYQEHYKDAREFIEKDPPVAKLIYDMEMEPLNKMFPNPFENRILQIGLGVHDPRTPIETMKMMIFTLGSISHLPEPCRTTGLVSDVRSFKKERNVLHELAVFEQVTGCSIHEMYNGLSFDLPFTVVRAAQLGMYELRNFGSRSIDIDTSWSPGRVRARETTKSKTPGVCQIDGLRYVQENFQSEKYHDLNHFTQKELEESKFEIDYNRIPEMQKTEEGRANLFEYLTYDVILTARLLGPRLKCLPNLLEESRIMCTPIEDLIQKGAQHKGFSMQRHHMAMPIHRLQIYGDPDLYCVFSTNRPQTLDFDIVAKGYKGAIVFKPEKGFYGINVPVSDPMLNTLDVMAEMWRPKAPDGRPIPAQNPSELATQDFSSLYPSIMRTRNLCVSTIIVAILALLFGWTVKTWEDVQTSHAWRRPTYVHDLENHKTDVIEDPRNPIFIRERIQMGVVPLLLGIVLSARSAINKLKEEYITRKQYLVKSGNKIDEHGCAVEWYTREIEDLDIKQNKRKLVANSFYGLGGLSEEKGQVASVGTAETVTLLGQYAIVTSRNLAELEISPQNGYQCQLKVVYGDTDSIMWVLFGPIQLIRNPLYLAFISKLLGGMIDGILGGFMKIAFEKVFLVVLLVEMKFYASLMWMPNGVIKNDTKGMRDKRRDSMQCQIECAKSFRANVIDSYQPDECVDFVGDIIGRIQLYDIPIHDMSKNTSFSKNLFDPTLKKTAAVNVATDIYEKTGRILQPGLRFSVVVVENRPNVFGKSGLAKLDKKTKRAVLLEDAVRDNLRYDRKDAIEQVTNAITPLLGIIYGAKWRIPAEDAIERLMKIWKRRPEFNNKNNKLFNDSPMGKMFQVDHTARCVNCKAPMSSNKIDGPQHSAKLVVPDLAKIKVSRVSNDLGDAQLRISGPQLLTAFRRAPRIQTVVFDDCEQLRVSGPFLHINILHCLHKQTREEQLVPEQERARLCEHCANDSALQTARAEAFATTQQTLLKTYDRCRACPVSFMGIANGVLTCASERCSNLSNRAYAGRKMLDASRLHRQFGRRENIDIVYEI